MESRAEYNGYVASLETRRTFSCPCLIAGSVDQFFAGSKFSTSYSDIPSTFEKELEIGTTNNGGGDSGWRDEPILPTSLVGDGDVILQAQLERMKEFSRDSSDDDESVQSFGRPRTRYIFDTDEREFPEEDYSDDSDASYGEFEEGLDSDGEGRDGSSADFIDLEYIDKIKRAQCEQYLRARYPTLFGQGQEIPRRKLKSYWPY